MWDVQTFITNKLDYLSIRRSCMRQVEFRVGVGVGPGIELHCLAKGAPLSVFHLAWSRSQGILGRVSRAINFSGVLGMTFWRYQHAKPGRGLDPLQCRHDPGSCHRLVCAEGICVSASKYPRATEQHRLTPPSPAPIYFFSDTNLSLYHIYCMYMLHVKTQKLSSSWDFLRTSLSKHVINWEIVIHAFKLFCSNKSQSFTPTTEIHSTVSFCLLSFSKRFEQFDASKEIDQLLHVVLTDSSLMLMVH